MLRTNGNGAFIFGGIVGALLLVLAFFVASTRYFPKDYQIIGSGGIIMLLLSLMLWMDSRPPAA